MKPHAYGPVFKKWLNKFSKRVQDDIIFDLSIGKEVPDAPRDHSFGKVAAYFRVTEKHGSWRERRSALQGMSNTDLEYKDMKPGKLDKVLYATANKAELVAAQTVQKAEKLQSTVVLNLDQKDLQFYSQIPGKDWYKMLPSFTKSRYDKIADVYGLLNVPYIDPEVLDAIPGKIATSIISDFRNKQFIEQSMALPQINHDYKSLAGVIYNGSRPKHDISISADEEDSDSGGDLEEYTRLKRALSMSQIRTDWPKDNVTVGSEETKKHEYKRSASIGLLINRLYSTRSNRPQVNIKSLSAVALTKEQIIEDIHALQSKSGRFDDFLDLEYEADGRYSPHTIDKLVRAREGTSLDQSTRASIDIEDLHQISLLMKKKARQNVQVMRSDPFNIATKKRIHAMRKEVAMTKPDEPLHSIDPVKLMLQNMNEKHTHQLAINAKKSFTEEELSPMHPDYLLYLNTSKTFKETILAKARVLHKKVVLVFTLVSIVQSDSTIIMCVLDSNYTRHFIQW